MPFDSFLNCKIDQLQGWEYTLRRVEILIRPCLGVRYARVQGLWWLDARYSCFEWSRSTENFYVKSADLGSTIALYNLGVMHEKGHGVPKSEEKATEYYQKSAMLGVNISQYEMWWRYYKGIGVKRDYEKAYTWALVAERDKPENIEGWTREHPSRARFFMEKIMSKEQVARANTEAQNLLMKISINTAKHEKETAYSRRVITAEELRQREEGQS